MNGNRGVTHSQGWLAKEKRPRRYALLGSRDREMMVDVIGTSID
jgi:hypothetical protein